MERRCVPRAAVVVETVPFQRAEDVWFWFIQAQAARHEGARVTAGQGVFPRPCEPVDVLRVVDRLYRCRRLILDHLLVLRHYGRRMMPPDARRAKEARAAQLWAEAMERMEAAFIAKGIVAAPRPVAWLAAEVRS